MKETASLPWPGIQPATRLLTIEATGDFWKDLTKPKIRLMGRWLERAGFKPGGRVSVSYIAPGVIELRSPDARLVADQVQPCPLQQPELGL